jgi:hypothetical protein
MYDTSLRGSALLRNALGFLKTLDYRRIVRRKALRALRQVIVE